jgi:ribosomal protein L44E
MTKKRKTEEELALELVCAKCGGTNIQVKAWVNANDHKQFISCTEAGTDDNWCDDCEEHTEHVERQEYDKDNVTNDYESNTSDG